MKAKIKTTLHLFKQNFKFSSAHFLIFDDQNAEKLHGHNYQVQVKIEVPDGGIAQNGFFIDFKEFKTIIKALMDEWDEHVLLPAQHKDIKTEIKGNDLHLHFRNRYYVFPKNEVILLPVRNTSVEEMSAMLAQKMLEKFQDYGVQKIVVRVEETQGQAASATITI